MPPLRAENAFGIFPKTGWRTTSIIFMIGAGLLLTSYAKAWYRGQSLNLDTVLSREHVANGSRPELCLCDRFEQSRD